MTIEQIKAAIPHREPMLLIDEIIERGSGHIVCQKRFNGDEFFFQGHYPDQPIVPGVVLCECAMQAGAVLLAEHLDQQRGVPVATRLQDVKFKKTVHPGDVIQLSVTLKERLADAFFLAAQVRCQGKLAARLDFACTLAPVE